MSTHDDAWDEHDDPWVIQPMLTPSYGAPRQQAAADTMPVPVVPRDDGNGSGRATRFVADTASHDDDAPGGVMGLEAVCEPDTSHTARMPRGVVASVVGLALVTAGCIGAWVWHERTEAAHVRTAASACRVAVRERGQAADRLRVALDSDDTETAAALGKDEIMDADTALPGALKKLLDTTPSSTVFSCSTSDTAALDSAAARARADRDAWMRAASDIESTSTALLDSNHARVLADARARVGKARDTGRALLGSSRGKVADESVRTKLSALLGKHVDDGDTAALEQHAKAIDAACGTVRASVTQREHDEQERARRQVEHDRASGAQAPQETGGRQNVPVPQPAPVQPRVPQTAEPVQPAVPDGTDRPVWSVPGPETDGALHDTDPGL